MTESDSKAPKGSVKKPNVFERASAATKKWFREMRSELKKVVWPTLKQVRNNSAIVLVALALVGVVIAVFDFAAAQGVQALINNFS